MAEEEQLDVPREAAWELVGIASWTTVGSAYAVLIACELMSDTEGRIGLGVVMGSAVAQGFAAARRRVLLHRVPVPGVTLYPLLVAPFTGTPVYSGHVMQAIDNLRSSSAAANLGGRLQSLAKSSELSDQLALSAIKRDAEATVDVCAFVTWAGSLLGFTGSLLLLGRLAQQDGKLRVHAVTLGACACASVLAFVGAGALGTWAELRSEASRVKTEREVSQRVVKHVADDVREAIASPVRAAVDGVSSWFRWAA